MARSLVAATRAMGVVQSGRMTIILPLRSMILSMASWGMGLPDWRKMS